jgi:Ca2+-binding RTX toxin-like protein
LKAQANVWPVESIDAFSVHQAMKDHAMKQVKKLSQRFAAGKHQTPVQSGSKRFGLQCLESRQLMTADFGLSGSTLAIEGSSQGDSAEVYVEGDQVSLTVTTYDETGDIVREKTAEYLTDEIGCIIFPGGGGDDLFVNDSPIESIEPVDPNDDDTTVVEDETLIDLAEESHESDLEHCVPAESDAESNSLGSDESDDDVIFGGSGDDWLLGGSGSDTIFGGTSPLDDELMRSVISGRLRL